MTETRQQCPECAKTGGDTNKDNLVVYGENDAHCFACGFTQGSKTVKKDKPKTELVSGVYEPIVTRGVTLDTCQKYNVRVRHYIGQLGRHEYNEHITIFPIYSEGRVIKQKIRSQLDKSKSTQRGDTKCMNMFGQSAFSPTKRLPIIVTEGEYDAMCMYQETGLPAISITRGSNGAHKELVTHLEWLSQWREVVLCFDMDEEGRKAASDCIGIFQPGTVKDIKLPLKDANEMVLAGRGKEIKQYISSAEVIRPSTIVSLLDIRDEILKQPEYGTPWPWKFLNNITYGCRLGETYMMAGPESCGKTQFMYEIVSHHLNQGCKVGFFDLERSNSQSTQRFLGAMHNKCFHRPGSSDWDAKFLDSELHRLDDMIKLYRPESGKLTLESILINIRYMNKCFGINFFILDNLTKLYSPIAGVKPYEFAEMVVSEICKLDTELGVTTFIINHLGKSPVGLTADITMGADFEYNTNIAGLSWATGRMAEPEQIYGGRNVTALPDYVFIFARNRMAENVKDKRTLHIKAAKTRFDSEYEGHIQKLLYDPDNAGKYKEVF